MHWFCHSIQWIVSLKITSDILMAFDHSDIAALALLDCSAAFYTLDDDILLRILSESFGVDDTVAHISSTVRLIWWPSVEI